MGVFDSKIGILIVEWGFLIVKWEFMMKFEGKSGFWGFVGRNLDDLGAFYIVNV
jgi:hypothetical protein